MCETALLNITRYTANVIKVSSFVSLHSGFRIVLLIALLTPDEPYIPFPIVPSNKPKTRPCQLVYDVT